MSEIAKHQGVANTPTSLSANGGISDVPAKTMSGYPALLIGGLLLLGGLGFFIAMAVAFASFTPMDGMPYLAAAAVMVVIGAFIMKGIYVLDPNYSAVMQLFGSYAGTDQASGMRFTNPFYSIQKVSRKARTHESNTLKVNDLSGNPIEVAAAVIWRVKDAARAVLQVESFDRYVAIQSETSLRKLVSTHPYDHGEDAVKDGQAAETPQAEPTVSLRGGGEAVVQALVEELAGRLDAAGIEVIEARITHLAYASEIAGAMLKRQQAEAMIGARKKLVQGAVEIVSDALDQLKLKDITVEEDRRAALVSNLLVVLVSDKDATPIVNAGAIY